VRLTTESFLVLEEPADEAECLVLAVNEPPVGMKTTCVFSELRISFSKQSRR
jgi:hypothetical protein